MVPYQNLHIGVDEGEPLYLVCVAMLLFTKRCRAGDYQCIANAHGRVEDEISVAAVLLDHIPGAR